MTYYEAEQEAVRAMQKADVPDADIDAGILLSFAGGMERAKLLAMRNDLIDPDALERYRSLIKRRCEREPLQYILGTWEFMGLEFEVNPACLIPRQDTELLVLKAYEAYRGLLSSDSNRDDTFRILDICTGSGCVIISLSHLINENKKSDIYFEGSDISEEALKVALKNAQRHAQDIHFHISDMFGSTDFDGGLYDIITANPPYIETGAIHSLNRELWDYEPMLALDGGEDGLVPYRVIASEAASHLRSTGILLVEIGDTQGAAVKALMENSGFSPVTVHKDLAGLDRVVECHRKN